MEEERKTILNFLLTESRYFKYFDQKTLVDIVNTMHKDHFSPQEVIMRPSDTAHFLYVFSEGKAFLMEELKNKVYLPVGSVYGEPEILARMIRPASITAETKCTVWSLCRDEFKAVIRRNSALNRNTGFLRSLKIFRNYTEEMLKKIEDVARFKYYGTDLNILVKPDNLYVVCNGHLKITEKKSGDKDEKKIIKVLRIGDSFDEDTNGRLSAFFPGAECMIIRKKVLNQFQEQEGSDCETEEGPDDQEYCNIKLDDLLHVETIGIGSFGRVDLVKYKKNSDRSFALKRVKKWCVVKKHQQDHALNERDVLVRINNPFITRCYRTYRDDRFVYFLSEVCLGGDVMRILSRFIYFDEDVARFITACVVEALDYLHNHHIIYRDLKPENLVIARNGYVKLTDFGMAKQMGYTGRTFSFCGTFPYFSPQNILNIAIDKGVDFWSLGVLIYELLCGDLLFGHKNRLEVFDAIMEGVEQVYFSILVRGLYSEDLIKKLCVREQSKRLGYRNINEIRNHPWFQEFDWSGLQSLSLPAPRILVPLLRGPFDTSNFDSFDGTEELPPEENSNWDLNF